MATAIAWFRSRNRSGMPEACQRAGVPARPVKVENSDHDFEPVPGKQLGIGQDQIHAITIEFFRKRLFVGK